MLLLDLHKIGSEKEWKPVKQSGSGKTGEKKRFSINTDELLDRLYLILHDDIKSVGNKE